MKDKDSDEPPMYIHLPTDAVPKTGTKAAQSFYITFASVIRFGSYVIGMALNIAHSSETAREVLYDTSHTDEERLQYQPSDDPVEPIVELAFHRQTLLELLLVRHIENYLNYISSLLFEIFIQRPECMKSGEKVDIEFVLQHQSIDTLVRGLAERKVETLSYSSFSSLRSFFEEHFNLSICPEQHFVQLNEAIENRNIIVHNRGIINKRYVENTGLRSDKVGKVRSLGIDAIESIIQALLSIVKSLDKEVRKHLKLSSHRFDIPKVMESEWKKAKERFKESQNENEST